LEFGNCNLKNEGEGMKKIKNKKEYKKPKIIFQKKIEILAAVCNSGWTGPGIDCRADANSCDVLQD
jgi:hypothetical protein